MTQRILHFSKRLNCKKQSQQVFKTGLLTKKGFKSQLTKVLMIMMVFRIVMTDMTIDMREMMPMDMIARYFDEDDDLFQLLFNLFEF